MGITVGMLAGGMQISGLTGEVDEPPACPLHNRDRQNFRAPASEHPPQSTGVLPHRDHTETRQGDTADTAAVTDPEGWAGTGFRVFVANPERRRRPLLAFELREPDPAALANPLAGVSERRESPPTIDSGFLEHLLAHLIPPRHAGDLFIGDPTSIDDEHASSGLGFLPPIELVDQIKAGPGHFTLWIPITLGESRLHHRQALVVGEPSRPAMTCQPHGLFGSGVEAVPEGGVPAHHRRVCQRAPTRI